MELWAVVGAITIGILIGTTLEEVILHRRNTMRRCAEFLCLCNGQVHLQSVVVYLGLSKRYVIKYYDALVHLVNSHNYVVGYIDCLPLDELLSVCFPEDDPCKH